MPNYREYITSAEWRDKHKGFLKRSRYRCAFSFLPVGKTIKGKYFGYAIHHMNYENLSSEQLWIDVIALHPLIHRWIIHGILSGFKRPSQQKNYPNAAQRLAHFWCCQPVAVRAVFSVLLAVNLVKLAL